MMRDATGRTCVWWQVRHWWYNHVSGPLGGWWETVLINGDPELMASLAEAEEDAYWEDRWTDDLLETALMDNDREEQG